MRESTFLILEHEARLKFNYESTEILGPHSIMDMDFKLTTQKPYKWTNEILGIWMTNNNSNLFNLNITPQLQKIDSLI